jgi:MFS family permease
MTLQSREAVLPGRVARDAVLRPVPLRPAYAPEEAPAFLGWQVVAGAFLVTMVGYGAVYSYSAFAEEIAAEFGSSRSAVTLTYVLSGSSCFFVSAISGPLADRVGARALAACGMVLVGLGLFVAAAARSLIEVHAGYGLLIGIGCGFAYVPALAAVQRWFTAHRGLASGVAVSGVGIGTALVPPAAEALSALGDWRVGFVLCGAAAIAVGLAGAMLLHPAPGEPPLRGGAAEGAGRELRSRAFAMAWGGTLLVSMPMTLPYGMLVATARDLGLPRGDAVALLGLIGLGSIAGRFLLAAAGGCAGARGNLPGLLRRGRGVDGVLGAGEGRGGAAGLRTDLRCVAGRGGRAAAGGDGGPLRQPRARRRARHALHQPRHCAAGGAGGAGVRDRGAAGQRAAAAGRGRPRAAGTALLAGARR